MRKTTMALIILAAAGAASAAFAQSTDLNQPGTSGGNMKADTPANQKLRNNDFSNVPGQPGNKSGPATQPQQQSPNR